MKKLFLFLLTFLFLLQNIAAVNFSHQKKDNAPHKPKQAKINSETSKKKKAILIGAGTIGSLGLLWLLKNILKTNQPTDEKSSNPTKNKETSEDKLPDQPDQISNLPPTKSEFDLPDDSKLENELSVVYGKFNRKKDFDKARFREGRLAAGWGTDDTTQGFCKGIALLKTMEQGKKSCEVDTFDVAQELYKWSQEDAPNYYKTKGPDKKLYHRIGLGNAISKVINHFEKNESSIGSEKFKTDLDKITLQAPNSNGSLMNSSISVISNTQSLDDAIKTALQLAHASHNTPQVDCYTSILTEIVWKSVNEAGSGKNPKEKLRSIIFDTAQKYKDNLDKFSFYQQGNAQDRYAMNFEIDKILSFKNKNNAELKAMQQVMEDPEILKNMYDAENISTESRKNIYSGKKEKCTIRKAGTSDVVYQIDSTGGARLSPEIWSILQALEEPNPGRICQKTMDISQNLGGDTDTRMAIAGQIIGGACGATGMPKHWRETLGPIDFAVGMSEALYLGGNGKPVEKISEETLKQRGSELLKMIDDRTIDPKLNACIGITLGIMAGDSMGADAEAIGFREQNKKGYYFLRPPAYH